MLCNVLHCIYLTSFRLKMCILFCLSVEFQHCASASVPNSNLHDVCALSGVVGTSFSVVCDVGFVGGGEVVCSSNLQFDTVSVACVPEAPAFDLVQKISESNGGFTAELMIGDEFGVSVRSLGDVNQDGVGDVVAGAYTDFTGAVYIIFLRSEGTVLSHQKIDTLSGGFTGTLESADGFGYSCSSAGDVDHDGLVDILIGAPYDDDGGSDTGAMYVIFLDTHGTSKSHQKISMLHGNFTADLGSGHEYGNFGSGSALGDLDLDGCLDFAVGAYEQTRLYILFANSLGGIVSHQVISHSLGGFTGSSLTGSYFGICVSRLRDLDNEHHMNVVVGADFAPNGGAVYIIYLDSGGLVLSHQTIAQSKGSFTGVLGTQDSGFGIGVGELGDINADGTNDIAVGANRFEPDGAMFIIFLNQTGECLSFNRIDSNTFYLTVSLVNSHFGTSTASAEDFNNDGQVDFLVGAHTDNVGTGAFYILFSNSSSVVSCGEPLRQVGYVFSSGASYAHAERTSQCATGFQGTPGNIICLEDGAWSTAEGCSGISDCLPNQVTTVMPPNEIATCDGTCVPTAQGLICSCADDTSSTLWSC